MMAGEMLKSPENPKATSTLVLPVFADGEQYGYANQAIPTNTGPNMTTLDHSQHSTELIGQSYEEDGKGNSDEEPDEEDVPDVDDYLQVWDQESIIIGDTIHYWLTINTWGDDCEDSYTESLCCDSAFAHKKKFYIFKFPKRFLEIS